MSRAGLVQIAPIPATQPERRLKVLIVDDDDASRSLVCDQVAETGHDCLEAPDGRRALDVLSGATVDLVILDLEMPVTDGSFGAGCSATPAGRGSVQWSCRTIVTSMAMRCRSMTSSRSRSHRIDYWRCSTPSAMMAIGPPLSPPRGDANRAAVVERPDGDREGTLAADPPPDLDPRRNVVLAGLPPPEFSRLAPLLEPVALPRGTSLEESDEEIASVYFPISGIASMMALGANGEAIDTVMIGREGMTGLAVFLGTGQMPVHSLVQVPLAAMRLASDDLHAPAPASASSTPRSSGFGTHRCGTTSRPADRLPPLTAVPRRTTFPSLPCP